MPTAYVSIDDAATRSELAHALSSRGWRVVECPSGYHVVASLAGWLDDVSTVPAIDLLVVAERSRGCRGSTIARGLRELGIATPIVVIDEAADAASNPASNASNPASSAERFATPAERVFVVDPHAAPRAITALASEIRLAAESPSPPREPRLAGNSPRTNEVHAAA